MKITTFAQMVCRKEGLKKPLSIAQVKEVIKVTDRVLRELGENGLYKIVRGINYVQLGYSKLRKTDARPVQKGGTS